ncbi:MurR/RpiR family transcriptional regulator [Brassicibacter mesophilus]|uniref:MurR/RpiR family transcriptional regulator n=1 Tax=Brassicibacter mesophilus TaxID=745119 RepID=UPI003D21A5C4
MNLSRLAQNYGKLTELERKIVEYIMNNPKKIVCLTGNELAQKLFVSKTSIINLSKKLGFDGYSELRYYVKDYIQNREKKEQALSYDSILGNIHDEITKTLYLQSEENIKVIAQKIVESRIIYVIARGASKPIADFLSSRLAILKVKSIFVGDPNVIDELGESLGAGEAILLMSLSGETEKILNIAKAARARSIDVIALTSFSNNSLQNIANYNMFCFANNTKTKYSDLISRLGLHTLTQILITYIAMNREE